MSWSEMGLGSLASAAERRGEMRQGRGHSQRWSEVPGWPRAGAAEEIRGNAKRKTPLPTLFPRSPPNSVAPAEVPLDPQTGGACLAFSFRWRRGYFKNERVVVADKSTESQSPISLLNSAG